MRTARALSNKRRFWLVLLLGLVALSVACSGTRRLPGIATREVGEASWYGLEERGRPSASGETMDPGAMTAAHRTLPFGTILDVTDLDTGKTVRVRINDRGPFARGRIIDLSHEAARRLGILNRGVAPVAITVVGYSAVHLWTVQLGAFRNADNAAALLRRLGAAGHKASISREGHLHRVTMGPYSEESEARDTARTLRRLGHEALVIRELAASS